ncbi:MAG TPA: hypothetical protein HA319_03525 [Nitrosopumilaceae archaeon]|nr:hypothetical protein [Nitrosopumilaceae archaeon]
MNKKILGVATVTSVIVIIVITIFLSTQPTIIQKNEKLGLYIMASSTTPTISELKDVYAEAASTGIGRSNIYLFWSTLEPQQGQYDWKIPDALMSLNKQNDLKVTLYFSIINNRMFGPFPNWMGEPQLDDNLKQKTVKILDDILSRYSIIDHVIIGGGIDAYFREHENEITKYKEFFIGVYDELKEKHPNIKFGNSFSLHGVLNHKQEDLVGKLNQGDFIAFTYFPVNVLNELDKTPEDAGKNLERILDLVGNKQIALLEISWTTAESVNGSKDGQTKFMQIVYDFFRKNEPRFEFLSWFRQYDRPIESCLKSLNTDFDISFGNEFVLQRTAEYICGSGLIDIDKNPKPAWEEFKKQVQFNPNS